MPSAKDFVKEVEALSLTITGYFIGKSGQNGLCDCIGLIMGAMTRLGHGSYPLHSTNYFARYEMANLRVLKSGETLRVGQIVYKANNDQSDLNDRYKPGGRYYRENDLLNYYHVGVITDLSPLEITHCTQDGSIRGIKRDSSTKGWTHIGEIRGVDFAADTNVGNNEEAIVSKTAFVTTPDGKPARLRSAPTTKGDYNTITKLDIGTFVDVLEVGTSDGEEWATVIAPDNVKGYMMTKFLKILEYADEEPPDQAENAQEQPSGASFEQEVLDRLTRIEERLNAIDGGVG